MKNLLKIFTVYGIFILYDFAMTTEPTTTTTTTESTTTTTTTESTTTTTTTESATTTTTTESTTTTTTTEPTIASDDLRWTSWERIAVGPCNAVCERTVGLERKCLNADPDRNKLCEGYKRIDIVEPCGADCVNALGVEWSEWTRFVTGPCNKECERTVIFKRVCLNERTQGNVFCHGEKRKTLTEPCYSEKCIHGHWSSWKQTLSTTCSEFCTRNLNFERTCSNPPPRPGGNPCEGTSQKIIIKECTGGKCEIASLDEDTKLKIIVGSVGSTLALMTCCAACCFYQKWKDNKRRKLLIRRASMDWSHHRDLSQRRMSIDAGQLHRGFDFTQRRMTIGAAPDHRSHREILELSHVRYPDLGVRRDSRTSHRPYLQTNIGYVPE